MSVEEVQLEPDINLAYVTPDMTDKERHALGVKTAKYFRGEWVYTENAEMIHPGKVQLDKMMLDWNEFNDPAFDDEELEALVEEGLRKD